MVSCTVTTRIPSVAASSSAPLRSRALAAQPRCDAQSGKARRVEEARAVRRRRPPAVVQQPAPLVAARAFNKPALPSELAAATAEFRKALVEHLGWPNHAAQAAAEEVGLQGHVSRRPYCCGGLEGPGWRKLQAAMHGRLAGPWPPFACRLINHCLAGRPQPQPQLLQVCK